MRRSICVEVVADVAEQHGPSVSFGLLVAVLVALMVSAGLAVETTPAVATQVPRALAAHSGNTSPLLVTTSIFFFSGRRFILRPAESRPAPNSNTCPRVM